MTAEKSCEQNRIVIDNRSSCEITGVSEVVSFDEYSIMLVSSFGDMEIEGEELKITSFSTEKGTLSVCGKISGLLYLDASDKKRPPKKRGSR